MKTKNELSRAQIWTGRVLAGLVVAFLALDGAMKLAQAAPVLEASKTLGIPLGATVGIGATLLVCTVLYVIPQTSVLGAILLTGYLGGAVFTHVRVGGPAFNVGFAVVFGVLIWSALWLREVRLRALLSRRPQE